MSDAFKKQKYSHDISPMIVSERDFDSPYDLHERDYEDEDQPRNVDGIKSVIGGVLLHVVSLVIISSISIIVYRKPVHLGQYFSICGQLL